MIAENIEDKNLIENYLKGDERALEILIKKYLKPIYNFAYKNVGNTADAEDITQEVFVKIWKNIKKFDQTKKFKPWIFQIAKNTSIDFLRKKKSIPFSSFENEEGKNVLLETIPGPELNLAKIIDNKKAVAALTLDLSADEKKIIQLRHHSGLTFKEIAEVFDESINTIKSRYRRIIINSRKLIKNN